MERAFTIIFMNNHVPDSRQGTGGFYSVLLGFYLVSVNLTRLERVQLH